MEENKIQIFTKNFLDVSYQAETRKGITNYDCENLISSLLELKKEYSGADALPISLVNIFIDMTSVLLTCGNRQHEVYGNEEQSKKIFHLMDALHGIAVEMTS